MNRRKALNALLRLNGRWWSKAAESDNGHNRLYAKAAYDVSMQKQSDLNKCFGRYDLRMI